MSILAKAVQTPENPNMTFSATAVDFEFKSVSIRANWPATGIVALAAVAVWLAFVFIRKGL